MALFLECWIGQAQEMDNEDFLPDTLSEKRKGYLVGLTTKEKTLYDTYSKAKGWSFPKMMRICSRAVILMDLRKVNSFEEAMKKATLLDIDGRSR